MTATVDAYVDFGKLWAVFKYAVPTIFPHVFRWLLAALLACTRYFRQIQMTPLLNSLASTTVLP